MSGIIGRLASSGKLAKVSPTALLDVLALDESESLKSNSEQVVISENGMAEGVKEVEELLVGVTDENAFVVGSQFMLRELKLLSGEMALVVNGRVSTAVPLPSFSFMQS